MKKIIYLLLIAISWYLAAMYRSFPLVVLAVCSMAVFLCAAVLPRILKRKLRVCFLHKQFTLIRKERTAVSVNVENRGWFPLGRLRLYVQISVSQTKTKKERMDLVGVDGNAAQSMSIGLPLLNCGLYEIAANRVEIYDYLSLFRTKIRLAEKAQLAVLPVPRKMILDFSGVMSPQSIGYNTYQALFSGSNCEEIRQIRSYNPGDSYRMIHWNQSAKTDSIMVKEYELNRDRSVAVVLDFKQSPKLSEGRINAFYEVLYALLTGLVEQSILVSLWWNAPENTVESCEIQNEDDCKNALIHLFRIAPFRTEQKHFPIVSEMSFRFGSDLILSFQDKVICQFTEEHYEEELLQRIYIS